MAYSFRSTQENTVSATNIADGSVSNTEFQYLDGAASNIQTQINKRSVVFPYVAGRYYRSMLANNNFTATSVTQNVLCAVPFPVMGSQAFDRLGIGITTAVNGAKVRLGIYNDTSGVPSSLIVDGGEVTLSGTGAQDAEVTINQTLAGGVYWLVFIVDTAGISANIASATAPRPDLGELNLAATQPYQRVTRAFSYAALPDPFGSPTLTSNSGVFGIKLRAA